MTKIYDKKNCEYKNGFVFCNGELVAIQTSIVDQLNKLDICLQKAMYLSKQPKPCPIPSLDGFVPKSERTVYTVKPETPAMDKRAEEAMAMLNDIEAKQAADRTNNIIAKFSDLIEWASLDWIPCLGENYDVHQLDVPVVGNPLVLSPDDIVNACTLIANVEGDVD